MDTLDFLAPVDDNFLCTICQNVMVSPYTCSQRHQFCFDCISTWLQQSQTCPSRCGDLKVHSLTKLRIVENLLDMLQVQCCHTGVSDDASPGPKNLRRQSRASEAGSDATGGCRWFGAVGDSAKHLRDECAYLEVKCSCEGCEAKVLRFRIAEHEACCQYREVSCEKCEERMQAREMSEHMPGCSLVEIDCPQECGARLRRADLGEHEQECANAVGCCSFAQHGCEVRGKRKKIGKHEEEEAVAHARLAARRAGRERERNAELEKALEEKTREVRKLQEELAAGGQGAAGQSYGEASVEWKIEDFTAEARAEKRFTSEAFRVQTKAGEYPLHLSAGFYRGKGSMTHGYVGLLVCDASTNGGNFPVGTAETKLTVGNEVRRQVLVFPATDKLERGCGRGFRKSLHADKIRGLSWTSADTEARDPHEPGYDVADLLEDDTLTVSGYMRLTPPGTISI